MISALCVSVLGHNEGKEQLRASGLFLPPQTPRWREKGRKSSWELQEKDSQASGGFPVLSVRFGLKFHKLMSMDETQ